MTATCQHLVFGYSPCFRPADHEPPHLGPLTLTQEPTVTRHQPGTRVRLRRGRVAHLVAAGVPATAGPEVPRQTVCGVSVLPDDSAALDTDPDCTGCYNRPAKIRMRRRR